MQETWVQPLGWEDPLEKEMQPTLVFLHGESQGQRSLASYSPWGYKESDTTGRLSMQASLVAEHGLWAHGLQQLWLPDSGAQAP